MTSIRKSAGVPDLLRVLDQKLLAVLVDVMRSSVLPDRPTSLTPEVFLCVLYTRYPRETEDFFRDPEPLRDLVRRFCPKPIKEPAELSPGEFAYLMGQAAKGGGVETPAVGSGEALGLHIPIESSLMNVLWNAARLSAAAGRKAGIADFISAFALDDELVARVYKESGLALKDFLGPPPELG
jgi:hypothetical protein